MPPPFSEILWFGCGQGKQGAGSEAQHDLKGNFSELTRVQRVLAALWPCWRTMLVASRPVKGSLQLLVSQVAAKAVSGDEWLKQRCEGVF